MLLLIDVGNTNICIARYEDDILHDSITRITTLLNRSCDEYYLIIKEMIKRINLFFIVLCSLR